MSRNKIPFMFKVSFKVRVLELETFTCLRHVETSFQLIDSHLLTRTKCLAPGCVDCIMRIKLVLQVEVLCLAFY